MIAMFRFWTESMETYAAEIVSIFAWNMVDVFDTEIDLLQSSTAIE